ncbi:50S ribosomal protein L15 [Methylobacterium gnaphalii]|uniref:Large ribosomal subunit protein uL15 n=1 Tax=Methylobacterium gnaphalii TaxID=1010610 RepID=A0A512JLK8_9HYPH|nr:50S ribosomal protein L15 [Methylobacterium gnaphalii]GEP10831.1 50S ribosomal protein L15 [Methylobacterium gnaphalii]GJD70791.1 50S ribosomal protein L15 [Methylobacterium gnaphalii]GLS50723.1 50S ribosomal protein L15 [Methylobacterium gnaphalii]
MKLNEIHDNEGATKARMRVGRGIGSGKGKTGGRGVKGQKARTGVSIKGFEGGQMPLHRRLPKRGFNNLYSTDLNEVNVGRVQEAIDAGKLDKAATVTVAALVEAGIINRARDGVKLLGVGELTTKLTFEVTRASKSAIEAVEKAGGSVTTVFAAGAAHRATVASA